MILMMTSLYLYGNCFQALSSRSYPTPSGTDSFLFCRRFPASGIPQRSRFKLTLVCWGTVASGWLRLSTIIGQFLFSYWLSCCFCWWANTHVHMDLFPSPICFTVVSLYYCGILARHCTFIINIKVRESHYVILPLWLFFYNLWISINRDIERAWRSWDQDKVRSNGQNSWYISWQLGRDSLFLLVVCLFSVGKLTPKDSFFWHY